MSGIKIIQIGMDEALEIQKKSDDEKYDAFVDKFKPKITSPMMTMTTKTKSN